MVDFSILLVDLFRIIVYNNDNLFILCQRRCYYAKVLCLLWQTIKRRGNLRLSNENQSYSRQFENHSAATEYIYNHKFLGWCRHNNLLIYRHQTATIGKKTSTYTGDFEIAPKGTYRAWINGVKKHILGHYPLEAALVIGLSSVTVGYFSQTGQPRNLMFHIAGNSSTGKSTASMLAISTTGSPEINQNQSRSLMKTWNTTENAIYGLLRGNHGAVLCLFVPKRISGRSSISFLQELIRKDWTRMPS